MDTKTITKEVKKLLKANGDTKLKDLAKKLAEKHSCSSKEVKEIILASSKFSVNEKVVSLKRKNSSSTTSEEENTASNKKPKIQESNSTDIGNQNSIQQWRKDNKIVLMHSTDTEEGKKLTKQINSDTKYYPLSTFKSASGAVSQKLLDQCTKVNGFAKPSPIQAQSWPILTNGRDVVGIAETGSGKTLAFALPALSNLCQKSPQKRRNPRMLVLSPTRELAMQSQQVLEEFGAVVQFKSVVLYGGVPKHTQVSELKQGVDCVVATPGRLKDLIQEGSCRLGEVDYLVLDEADRMLDMGFEEDVRFIISQCKPKEQGRQTAMFSATWPAAIQKIAMDYMTDPIRVYVGFESIVGSNGDAGGVDDSLSANKRVKQTVEVIEDRERDARLRELLRKVHAKRNNRILIFALYKKEAERLENSLKRDGWNCCSIHGNKNQAARTQALEEFKNGSCPLLVATDVAARGLDIPNVEVVINFTFPLTIEDYVHRIGRTGRAGKSGESYTFFQTTDKSHAGELQQVMKQAGQPVPEELMKFGSTIKKKEHKLYGNFGPKTGVPMKKPTKIRFD